MYFLLSWQAQNAIRSIQRDYNADGSYFWHVSNLPDESDDREIDVIYITLVERRTDSNLRDGGG